jgi:nucleotide-binding universal stress UspA family protein
MKTLMATDGSEEATAALRVGSRLLRSTHNQIDVLCVAPEFYRTGSKHPGKSKQVAEEEYRRRISVETDSILKRAQQVLTEEGMQTGAISKIGSPSDQIIGLAGDYDVTVVGARSRFKRSELGLGPVGSRVVEYAPGVVLVARELAGEANLRVLLGVDGSSASKHALRSLISYFNLDEAEITLMHVVETPWIHLGLDREWFDYPETEADRGDLETRLDTEMRLEAEEVIEDAYRMLEDRSYSVMTTTTEGNPATEILGEAESKDYDLIVLGTTGLSDAKHRVLGSVSAKVAWNASCSVALVKHLE